jgi:hypothetical protein
MPHQRHRRLFVTGGIGFYNAVLQRPAQLQRKPIVVSLGAEHVILSQGFSGDEVLGPADVTLDSLARSIAGRDRRSRGAEIDADTENVIFLLGALSYHRLNLLWLCGNGGRPSQPFHRAWRALLKDWQRRVDAKQEIE